MNIYKDGRSWYLAAGGEVLALLDYPSLMLDRIQHHDYGDWTSQYIWVNDDDADVSYLVKIHKNTVTGETLEWVW